MSQQIEIKSDSVTIFYDYPGSLYIKVQGTASTPVPWGYCTNLIAHTLQLRGIGFEREFKQLLAA
jgi:hypothetical protein